MDGLIQFLPLLVLLGLGMLAGGYTERRHLKSLDDRESQNGDFLITQLRSFPDAAAGTKPPMLLVGEAAIATDYLKTFLAGLRKIFGGELRGYQTLMVRARREALQRIVEQARAQGYNALCNVRYCSADVGGNSKARKVALVAILASATAYHRVDDGRT